MIPFCGREEEMRTLLECWEAVKSGGGARTVVLLAETGLGKTRLVQEFYERLVSLEQGAGGYWPPRLAADGGNLLLNPASWNTADAMPFLWWGVRLAHHRERNAVSTGSLAAHVEASLVHHLEPFHKEQRRRQRLVQLAKLGGAVAADAVVDLVPFLGLVKKVGEVGMELKGIHDAWRQDREVLDGATLVDTRRDSLVDQLLADLGKLFSGPTGKALPAVIVIDDAQFSSEDPGVTAFVRALLPAMAAGGWPLLLLVTHWEREYREVAEGPPCFNVARILTEHGRLTPGAVVTLPLGPVQGLEGMVTSRLPGLTTEQVRHLTARSGGNPQFLDELVLLALDGRSRAWFEGRDPRRAMTPAGLEAILSKSVHLHDVVAERFAGSSEQVQKAVALAGVQGDEFLERFVKAVWGALEVAGDAAEVDGALQEASGRHGFVTQVAEGRAVFNQRIYLETARDFLPSFYDEAEVMEALRTEVRDVLLGARELEVDVASQVGFWQLVVNLFETADSSEDRRLAAHGLHRILVHLNRNGELELAHRAALRQAELISGIPDDLLDADLDWLRSVNDTLAAVGVTDVRREVLERLVVLTGATYDDDVNTWSVSLHVQVLLDLSELHGAAGATEERVRALAAAGEVMSSLDGVEPDVDSLEASLRLHRLYAEWFEDAGQLEKAVAAQERALELAAYLRRSEDTPRRRFEQARAQAQLAATLMLRGDTDVAARDLEIVAADLRTLLAEDRSVPLEIHLVRVLDDLATARARSGDLPGAKAFLREGSELMRRHLSMAEGVPVAIANLADALERMAELQHLSGEIGEAWEHATEALELRRRAASISGAAPDLWAVGFSLVRAAHVALAAEEAGVPGMFSAGYELLEEGLELLRDEWRSVEAASSAWRLLQGLRLAVVYELGRSASEAAMELLQEADTVRRALPEEESSDLKRLLADLELLRAQALEAIGDVLGASQSRATATFLAGGTQDASDA